MTTARFPLATLSDIKKPVQHSLIGGPFGSKLVQKDYEPHGIPVVRGANLPADRRFSFTDFVFVSPAKVERDLRGNRAFPGDIVVTQRGTLGQVGLIPGDSPYDEFVVSQSQMKLTVDDVRADAAFVYYALKSPLGQHEILSRALTAGVPHINLAIFGEVTIPLPPLSIQRKIAAVLSAYDDLVDNNRRRIELLEEMAQWIYRERFVAFRYPGHDEVPLVASKLGEIPDGWSVQPFSALGEYVNGYAFKPTDWGADGLPIIKIRELKAGVTPETPRYGGTLPDKFRVQDGDLLFSWSAHLDAYLWDGGNAWLNQHLFRVDPAEGIDKSFLFHALREHMGEFRARAQGTTMRHIKRSALSQVLTAVPSERLMAGFSETVTSLHDLVLRLTRAIHSLGESRDLLLARLLSGEIDVDNLDISAKEAAA
jgi:type I restriction enzyme, S subunit